MAKSSVLFQGSFMGLEFILSKDKDSVVTNLINQIFNPEQMLGGDDYDDSITQDEMKFYDNYENGKIMPYVDREIVDSITAILEEISEAYVKSNYNSDELNSNGIYPKVWHNDDSTNKVFNKRQILLS